MPRSQYLKLQMDRLALLLYFTEEETSLWLAHNIIVSFSVFSSVQLLSRVQPFAASWTAAHQASLSITNSWSLLKLMSIELVIPSNHLILCHPFLLPPSIFLSIRVFANESVVHIRWLKYWSFSFNISPSNEYSGLKCLQTTLNNKNHRLRKRP